MNTILYMATTINGMVAKKDNDTSFVSEKEWENFSQMVNSVGNIIIGSTTYQIMKEDKEFDNFNDITVIVVSSNNIETNNPKHLLASSPKQALEILGSLGFKKALVAGGGKLNASFMSENLVDEIYLDMEPFALGQGIALFKDKEFETKLELVEIKSFSDNEIQIHYKVVR